MGLKIYKWIALTLFQNCFSEVIIKIKGLPIFIFSPKTKENYT